VALGIDVFETPKGREYALPWGDLSNKDRSGMLKMTDYLFNYYFFPIAFGADGAFYERSVVGSNYSMKRRIGGPSISVSRDAYKVRVTPTWRGGQYDAGTQLFAIDGKDVWNFEITGKISEFRIWVRQAGRAGQLKRTLTFKTITGVGSGSLALAAGN
jgi:hypothetical protein